MRVLLLIAMLLCSQPLWATTYYVATTGNNANTCTQAQTITTPKATLSNVIANCTVAADDIVYLRSGSYDDHVDISSKNGSAGHVITISSYTGETATLLPTSSSAYNRLASSSYITFVNISFDCTNIFGATCWSIDSGSSHLTFSGGEVKNNGRAHGTKASVDCMGTPLCFTNGMTSDASNSTWNGVAVHDNGNGDFDHGFYMTGDNNVITNCLIYGNATNGIQIFSGTGWTITNNFIHDNGQSGVLEPSAGRGGGIVFESGSSAAIYNNLVYKNFSAGIHHTGSSGVLYNNTMYGNSTDSSGFEGYGGIQLDGSSNTVRNNIAYGDGIYNSGNEISNTGSGNTVNTNLTTNPSFTDANGNDFTLQCHSAAIDTGADLSGVFTNDILGVVTRPVDAGSCGDGSNDFDIGAYEFSIGQGPPPPPPYTGTPSKKARIRGRIK